MSNPWSPPPNLELESPNVVVEDGYKLPLTRIRAPTTSLVQGAVQPPLQQQQDIPQVLGDVSNLLHREASTSTVRQQAKRVSKKRNASWTDEDLKKAFTALDKGLGIEAAARISGIPISSFRDHAVEKDKVENVDVKGFLMTKRRKNLWYTLWRCKKGAGL